MTIAGPSTVRKARVADIVMVAARITRMDAEIIIGPRRDRKITRVRQACYVVARRSGHSLPQIGRLMGGRDHSSVMHGIQVAAETAERDEAYGAFIEALDSQSLNVKPMEPLPREAGEAIPDKPEPPLPSLIMIPRAPDQKARNDFTSHDQPDGWQHFHDDVIAGSAALAKALMSARA